MSSHTTHIPISPTTTLQVTSSGPPTTQPTLIFLHFWGGSSRTFSKLVSQPSLQSYHCISPSFRGWGTSTGPQDAEAYHMLDLARDIEALLSQPALNITSYILIGHSMGAKVASLIAGRRVVAGLKGVVLLAPAPPGPLVLPEEMRVQQLGAYSSAESAEFVVRNVLTSSAVSDEEVEALVEDIMRGNEYAVRAWTAYGMGEDIREEVKGIAVPVLVVAGELDRVEPLERVREKVVEVIEGAELMVVKGVGHLLPVEAPAEVADVVKSFVSKVGGGS